MTNKSFEINEGPKQNIRNLLVKNSPITPNAILTLPGRKMLCVETFKKAWPNVTVIGIERSREDWETISQKMLCYNCDVKTYIDRQQNGMSHLDLVFLDYFTYLNTSVEEDIASLLLSDNLLHKGKTTILGITLSKGIRSEADEMLLRMKKSAFNYDRRKITNNLTDVGDYLTNKMIDVTIQREMGIELTDSIEYKAGEGSSTMYFYCFKITKY
jgi:hypothetical protein